MTDLTFFSPAPRPENERERQAKLDALGIVDTPAAPVFDAIVKRLASEMGTAIAAVSLVDRDRQWFLARTGLDVSETPRACSFCAHAMLEPGEIFCVTDATLDPRFAGNPLVTAPDGIRFYAGAPLVLRDGTAIGALCAIDSQVRPTLSDEERQRMRELAGRVVEEIEALGPSAGATS